MAGNSASCAGAPVRFWCNPVRRPQSLVQFGCTPPIARFKSAMCAPAAALDDFFIEKIYVRCRPACDSGRIFSARNQNGRDIALTGRVMASLVAV
jgi:hypothetical protein